MDEKITRFLINPFIYICIVVTFFIGIMGCIQWYIAPSWLNDPSYVGMAFNTAFVTTLASIGIFFIKQRINLLETLIGIIVFLFGSITITEYLLNLPINFDKVLIQFRLPPNAPMYVKMSPNAAIAFTLIGLTLAFWKYCKSNIFARMATLISATTTCLLSAIALTGYLANIPTLYKWGNSNFMAFLAAISLILLSAALFGLFYITYPNFIKRKEVKITTSCFVILFTLFVLSWQTFNQFVLTPKIAVIVWFLLILLSTTVVYFWQIVKKDNVFLEEDIEKRKAIEDTLRDMQEKLDQLAHYDPVTELPNRYYFQEVFTRALAKASRHKELFAILFLDLDHFKNINDSLGHTLGDLLLKKVGKILRKNIRENDFVARIGGDEFIILAESISNTEEIEKFAERIIKIFRTPIQINNTNFIVSLSIGVAIYPYAGDTTQKLLQNADTAMYQAKEKSRRTYQIYNEQLHEKSQRITLIEKELHTAIEKNEFYLMYQPIFDLTTNKIISTEALIRWQHPTLGNIEPHEFIPLSESNGTILKIGEWVFKEACQQLSHWQKKFQNLHLEISVNCSILQLEQYQHFIRSLKETIEHYQLSPNKIVLELTETGLMKQIKNATTFLAELKQYGFSIAIDDFGSGYSSLNYLKAIPISILKIDKSFASDLEQNKTTQEITKAIIQLAKTLKLSVVAEGVETKRQLQILMEFGCQFAQGYYLARPMVASDCEKFMEEYL